jgi:hypothetical protein
MPKLAETESGLDSSKFCLHSLRSGGTTAAAANNISDTLIKEHGRWKTDFSKDGYIQECNVFINIYYILPHYARPNIKQLNYMGTKTSES